MNKLPLAPFLVAAYFGLVGLPQAYATTPTLNTLASFSGANGSASQSGLIADAAGNLYGTTTAGGDLSLNGGLGYGTVFQVAAGTHALTALATFNNTNGSSPYASVLADGSGNLYGTTEQGGTGNFGTVFEVVAGSHTITTLVNFDSTHGAYPFGSLIADANGNLYGTTHGGGASSFGTVFQVAAGSHALTTLATFNGANGKYPWAGLVADAAGNLLGTTAQGGSSNRGTVFKVVPQDLSLTTILNFTGNNGAYPQSSLVADSHGNLFGTTTGAGVGTSGYGTVFELAADTYAPTTLATFNKVGTTFPDGYEPNGSVLVDAAGNLFGTTISGGLNGGGNVFEVAAGTHALTALASFGVASGADPSAELRADSAGNLYGTTYAGGAFGDGTVFEITNSGFAVPEPASLSLLFLATLPLLTRRRRN